VRISASLSSSDDISVPITDGLPSLPIRAAKGPSSPNSSHGSGTVPPQGGKKARESGTCPPIPSQRRLLHDGHGNHYAAARRLGARLRGDRAVATQLRRARELGAIEDDSAAADVVRQERGLQGPSRGGGRSHAALPHRPCQKQRGQKTDGTTSPRCHGSPTFDVDVEGRVHHADGEFGAMSPERRYISDGQCIS